MVACVWMCVVLIVREVSLLCIEEVCLVMRRMVRIRDE